MKKQTLLKLQKTSIGSDPAGITILILLAQREYDVMLFDSRGQIGGILWCGIPEFRLPEKILSRYQKELPALGVKIRLNATIGGARSIDDLFHDGYRSIFIGRGVWRSSALKIPTGIFVCGDVAHGAMTVVEAVKYAKLVAQTVDDYMRQALGRSSHCKKGSLFQMGQTAFFAAL